METLLIELIAVTLEIYEFENLYDKNIIGTFSHGQPNNFPV